MDIVVPNGGKEICLPFLRYYLIHSSIVITDYYSIDTSKIVFINVNNDSYPVKMSVILTNFAFVMLHTVICIYYTKI